MSANNSILAMLYVELRRRSKIDVAADPSIDTIKRALDEIERRAVLAVKGQQVYLLGESISEWYWRVPTDEGWRIVGGPYVTVEEARRGFNELNRAS